MEFLRSGILYISVCSTVGIKILRPGPDLNLLNPSLLIPTWFPVEMAWVILGQMLYRVRRAPPGPSLPLRSTDWGPEGR
jgi:hypothetical protein